MGNNSEEEIQAKVGNKGASEGQETKENSSGHKKLSKGRKSERKVKQNVDILVINHDEDEGEGGVDSGGLAVPLDARVADTAVQRNWVAAGKEGESKDRVNRPRVGEEERCRGSAINQPDLRIVNFEDEESEDDGYGDRDAVLMTDFEFDIMHYNGAEVEGNLVTELGCDDEPHGSCHVPRETRAADSSGGVNRSSVGKGMEAVMRSGSMTKSGSGVQGTQLSVSDLTIRAEDLNFLRNNYDDSLEILSPNKPVRKSRSVQNREVSRTTKGFELNPVIGVKAKHRKRGQIFAHNYNNIPHNRIHDNAHNTRQDDSSDRLPIPTQTSTYPSSSGLENYENFMLPDSTGRQIRAEKRSLRRDPASYTPEDEENLYHGRLNRDFRDEELANGSPSSDLNLYSTDKKIFKAQRTDVPVSYGRSLSLSDQELILLLKQSPKDTVELRKKKDFQKFFQGMPKDRMLYLLEMAFSDLNEKERKNRVQKRLELLGDVLV